MCVCFLFCDSILRFILLMRFILLVIFCFGLFVISGLCEIERKTECKRERKRLFNPLADEQLFLNSKSYCSSASIFLKMGRLLWEGFGEFFVIFECFIWFEEAGTNALIPFAICYILKLVINGRLVIFWVVKNLGKGILELFRWFVLAGEDWDWVCGSTKLLTTTKNRWTVW